MSVFEKITDIQSAIENFSKDKPLITVLSNYSLVAENYNTVRYFCDDSITINFSEFDLTVNGNNLTIEYFSPMKLVLRGNLFSLQYDNCAEGEKENKTNIMEE